MPDASLQTSRSEKDVLIEAPDFQTSALSPQKRKLQPSADSKPPKPPGWSEEDRLGDLLTTSSPIVPSIQTRPSAPSSQISSPKDFLQTSSSKSRPNDLQPALYVRALYDYSADAWNDLSFRQGDIIEVLTRLESGWWVGILHGVRGLIPSNYCAIVTAPDATALLRSQEPTSEVQVVAESGTEDKYDNNVEVDTKTSSLQNNEPADSAVDYKSEEAAFWIPQTTPDGRLSYFNTLSGVSTTELSLENLTLADLQVNPLEKSHLKAPSSQASSQASLMLPLQRPPSQDSSLKAPSSGKVISKNNSSQDSAQTAGEAPIERLLNQISSLPYDPSIDDSIFNRLHASTQANDDLTTIQGIESARSDLGSSLTLPFCASVERAVLSVSRDPASPQACMTTSCLLEWELFSFMQKEFDPQPRVSSVVTLVGALSRYDAHATTCSEYISETWPEVGPVLLRVIEAEFESSDGQTSR